MHRSRLSRNINTPYPCHRHSVTRTEVPSISSCQIKYLPISRPGTSVHPSTTSHHGATINCDLAGGTRATAATCTGSSEIEGLGLVGSSTTLASTQINYATLTVTAGRAMLAAASEAAAQATDSESTGEGSGDKSAASSLGEVRWEFCGWVAVVAGMLAVGIL